MTDVTCLFRGRIRYLSPLFILIFLGSSLLLGGCSVNFCISNCQGTITNGSNGQSGSAGNTPASTGNTPSPNETSSSLPVSCISGTPEHHTPILGQAWQPQTPFGLDAPAIMEFWSNEDQDQHEILVWLPQGLRAQDGKMLTFRGGGVYYPYRKGCEGQAKQDYNNNTSYSSSDHVIVDTLYAKNRVVEV